MASEKLASIFDEQDLLLFTCLNHIPLRLFMNCAPVEFRD